VIDNPFYAPDEFASDVERDPSLADDPFYRKTPKPEMDYSYHPIVPTSASGSVNFLLLIGAIVIAIVVAAATVIVIMQSAP